MFFEKKEGSYYFMKDQNDFIFKDLLKKTDCFKLELFHLIMLPSQKANIKDLMETLDLSRSSVKRQINEMNIFFEHHLPDVSIEQDAHYNYVLQNKTSFNHSYLFHYLQLHLLEHNNKFRLLLLLATTTVTKFDVCDDLNISDITLYKLLQEVNKALIPFKIRIDSEHSYLFFAGREAHIRLFICALLTTSYQNIRWPFKSISTNSLKYFHSSTQAKRLTSQLNTSQRRIEMILMSLLKRTKRFIFIEDFDQETKGILNVYDTYGTIRLHVFATIDDPTTKEAEFLFTNFIARMFDTSIDERADKIMIGEQLMTLDSPLIALASKLCESFIDSFNINNQRETRYLFMYYIVLYHVFVAYFNFDLKPILKSIYSDTHSQLLEHSEVFTDISAFYQQALMTTHTNPIFSLPANQHQGATLFYSLYQAYYTNPLSILVNYSKDTVGELLITNKIRHIFSEKTITFVNKMENADIIISDSIEGTGEDFSFFYFEDCYDQKTWTDLLNYLQQVIFKRTFI